MGYMIMLCLGLKLVVNLEKIFTLDKMELDRIFLLMVRLLEFSFYFCLFDCIIIVMLVGGRG